MSDKYTLSDMSDKYTLSDMMNDLAAAKTVGGYTVTQRTWNRTIAVMARLVTAYDAMPDGPLGRGLTNGPFLEAKAILANNAPEWAKCVDETGRYLEEAPHGDSRYTLLTGRDGGE